MGISILLVVRSTELGSMVLLLWAAAKLRTSEVNKKVRDSMLTW